MQKSYTIKEIIYYQGKDSYIVLNSKLNFLMLISLL